MKKELTNEEIQNFIEAFNKDKEQAIKMIYDKGMAEGFISKLEETVKDNIEALYHITAFITLLWDKLTYGSNISLKVTCEGDKKLFYGMYEAGAEYNDSEYDFFNFHQGYAAAYKELYKMPCDKALERIGRINLDLNDNNLKSDNAWVSWYKSLIWHDISEEPNRDMLILFQLNEQSFRADFFYFKDWEKMVNRYSIKRWAYIEDLIPIYYLI